MKYAKTVDASNDQGRSAIIAIAALADARGSIVSDHWLHWTCDSQEEFDGICNRSGAKPGASFEDASAADPP
ncbi:hypothetical protein BraRD5C2_38670 [Bradyrhizobium sp. RD5-C2]|nr:hypothetical protein BraRD5C2_38670 [Bradyrhizobium sp. RD5-C2]